MKLDLYKQAVRLIKVAESPDYKQPLSESFYSNSYTQGLVPVPREKNVPTKQYIGNKPWLGLFNLWQDAYSSGDIDIRDGDSSVSWRDIKVPFKNEKLNEPSEETRKYFQDIGLDFSSPQIQGLGNQPDRYTFYATEPYYSKPIDTINYTPVLFENTPIDRLKVLAHETAHRNAQNATSVADPSYDNFYNDPDGTARRWDPILPWQGIFRNEWPAVVNEWTYGSPDGMIMPIQKKWRPLRTLTTGDDTDPYYKDMFPLVDMRYIHSEPGRIYSYWHSPGEPDLPSDDKKRIVYETPNGYWVDQFGKWTQTGGQVFDPKFNNLSHPTNIRDLPSLLQRHISNMRFLSIGQPTEERRKASEEARQQAQDLLAPLALRRKSFKSGKNTYGQMIDNVLKENNAVLDTLPTNASPEQIEEALNDYWMEHSDISDWGSKYLGVKDFNPGRNSNLHKIIEENPMWDPNMVLQPIPIGLAGLQKKYSISPSLDEPTDWRDVKQYKAIIRDAQHSYDLQNELDTYGPKDGGVGA